MIRLLLNLFFPKTCSGCHALLLGDEKVICTSCRHEIPLTNHHTIENNEVMQKFYGRIPIEFGAALFYFHKKGIVQEMMHQLKYKGQEEISQTIGNWYAEELKNNSVLQQIDYIIPVPIHPKRLRERGYNQVEGFGKALSEAFSIPFRNDILIKTKHTQTQSKKNLLDRSELKESSFDVFFDDKLHHKHFLLVDDIITTGATLEACSRALLKIPHSKISIVCMAMTHN